jgi:Kef-type K+ transport system membrane component KefB
MLLILLYSGLLITGMIISQVVDLAAIGFLVSAVTMICLAYIMIEVGLEFTLDKKRLRSYGWDCIVAATAAALPWIFCAIYFKAFFQTPWKEALLIGRFAAPTSAGVLFAMLAAAGLGTTWLFRKAQVLAIFDDLDTVLLMIPLQILFVGMKLELMAVVGVILVLLAAAYHWLHLLKFPIGKLWLLGYGTLIVILCQMIERTAHVHIEVLLPAFVFGCILFNPHDPNRPQQHPHEHAYIEPEKGLVLLVDRFVKSLFMFLVGLSLPKIMLGEISILMLVWHVLALTILSNLGKLFPAFCYREEAPINHRIALSIAMFPRGEVGAGVLLVALGYGLKGLPMTLSALSLALNLLLTGVFITWVISLLKTHSAKVLK